MVASTTTTEPQALSVEYLGAMVYLVTSPDKENRVWYAEWGRAVCYCPESGPDTKCSHEQAVERYAAECKSKLTDV